MLRQTFTSLLMSKRGRHTAQKGSFGLMKTQQHYSAGLGFTLLELLLVLVIIGIGAALVGSRLGSLRDTASVDMAAKRLRDQARACQQMAIANAQIVRLRVNTQHLTADIESINNATGAIEERHAPLLVLQSGADAVTLTYERSDGVANPSDYIDVLFYPDYRCDPPGRFTLASQKRFASVHIAAGAQMPTVTDSRAIEFRQRLRNEELPQ
jgi:type II secretion system protein H